ncbi:3-hydroxyacyl-CoA dehydrogenase family protein [Amycolatopsis orientalis]|uniref:3-hydroxyacyl-CoA dehydrogenase family protein n=1 Tax=Amycolatopsis orientalis TaxID=31958 RepID=UPI000399BB61|nr:3-hydroxyacyl-CoA dehydrogenase family protein [Amycolatopsis orientalis]
MNRSTDFAVVAVAGDGAAGRALADALARSGRRVTAGDVPAEAELVVADGSDLAATTALLLQAAGRVGEDVPLVTTSSAVSVTEVAAALPNPGRVAGLRLFENGPGRGTVEVVRGLRTEESIVDRLAALADDLPDATAVVVGDRPGFLLDALFLPYLNDVIQELDDGLATAEDIDLALRLGLGYAAGPFELLDRMGLDVHLRATQAVYEATGDARYAPPPLLRRMAAAGRAFRSAETPEN